MSEVLVLVEQDNGEVKKVTHELLTLARRLGEPAAVVVGEGAEACQADLAAHGAEKVYVATGDGLNDFVATPKVAALQAAVEQGGAIAVLVPATTEGKETAGRLALRIGAGVITDAVGLSDASVTEQSVFGGTTVVQSAVTHGIPIIAVRPNSAAPEPVAAAGTQVDLPVTLSDADQSKTGGIPASPGVRQ